MPEESEQKSRNADGRSSIYLGADGSWHGWVTVGRKTNGKPDRRHRRGTSLTAVTLKVRALEKLRDEGRTPNLGKQPTVRKWILFWLDNIAPATASEDSIEHVYRPRLVNRVIPVIGNHRMDELQPEHLDELYIELRKVGLSPKSIHDTHVMLSRCFKMAVRRRLVAQNIAALLDAPSYRIKDITPLSQVDARLILDVVAGLRNSARWSVALSLGLRQAEALGMRWSFVDLDAGQVQIYQIRRRRYSHGCEDPVACVKDRHVSKCIDGCVKHARYCPSRLGGEWRFQEPKGGKTRPLPLPEPLVAALRAHKAVQAAERLAAGERWQDWDLVFARPDGRPLDPTDDRATWKEILRTAGIPETRLHDARHTAATLLLEQGVDIRVVQEILGHSSLNVTKRYTHVTSTLAKNAAGRMARALWD